MAWNQSTGEAAKPQPKKPSALRGVIAGVAVVAAAVAIFFAMSGKDEKPKARVEKEPERIKEVKPAAAPKAEHVVNQVDEDREKAARAERFKNMSPVERMQFCLDEAQKKPLDLTPVTNRTFKTGTEQIMGWIFSTQPGDTPPMLPRISIRDEAHLAEILIAKNPALEGDSEKVKETKEIVELAKKELMKYIKEGGDVHEFLQYYRDQLVQAHDEFVETRKSVIAMYRSGEDTELCDAYMKKVNERLAEKGIKPVSLPPAFFEKLKKQ